MEIDRSYAVQMRGIAKYFGSFCALDHVDLDVKKGSIHAILGENGAGKSTLMNILYGLYQAEEGEIFLQGEKVSIKNPSVAIAHGIGMVHQHFMLVENFTVTENIILGNEVASKGIIQKKKAREKVQEIINTYGLVVDPDAKIEDISVGMQQRVEILKALYRGADLLILDEPTAVLTPQEIQELIQIMKQLTSHGKTIIIITHKLKEIQACAEECTIIRRGKWIDRVQVQNMSLQEMAEKMVGHPVRLQVEKKPAQPQDIIFSIENLTVKDMRGLEAVKQLSLQVRKGEIFGIVGIDGNGQKELVEAVTGLREVSSGTIAIHGKPIQNHTPKQVIDAGISTIHEDRHRRGLVLDYSVADNAVLERFRERPFAVRGVRKPQAVDEYTQTIIKQYDVRPQDCKDKPIRALSGGNQQKVIIGREISNQPDLLIAVQPTRGLDVGAIENIHKMLVEERDRGKAILLISLELEEVMNVADTIGVIYAGKIVKTFLQGELSEKEVGLFMAGGKQDADVH